VVDAVSYHQYQPTAQIRQIARDAGMTQDGTFMFYASRPVVQSKDDFNRSCERREPGSPILGCYSARRIYIYDITDQRLDGIKTVTAAHEMLHAAYERMSQAEKDRLRPLLEDAYSRLSSDSLTERMAYYERTQPGESLNELHSIIGTEFLAIGDELEEHYARFFTDRQALAKLHAEVEAVFDELSREARALAARIDSLVTSINQATVSYNEGVRQLNREVDEFNQRARQPGGFTTQAEFEAELARLNSRQQQLEASKQAIESDIVTYQSLLARLDAINAESAGLNRSLDSNLEAVPTL